MTLLPPIIEHQRDVIRDDEGGIAQVYNCLYYLFGNPSVIKARTYLDSPTTVSILSSGDLPADVLDYLKARFSQINQLGSSGAYEAIWTE